MGGKIERIEGRGKKSAVNIDILRARKDGERIGMLLEVVECTCKKIIVGQVVGRSPAKIGSFTKQVDLTVIPVKTAIEKRAMEADPGIATSVGKTDVDSVVCRSVIRYNKLEVWKRLR
ncbi:MAG: hypothetical protein RMK97_03575 [Sutterellaceae bacterium]|nr:hypothetical protein [Burkholderiaceae bacterium]MCX7901113.1 hypothetical protein [Burkholderiaceae bacterium]MDW8429571.1 hypothetical protein [Sutterellaceae bacterium]